MNILALETSCDETAAAVTNGRLVLSNVVATQIASHQKFGGVVPEIASRQHVEAIVSVTQQALAQAELTLDDIGAVAVTCAPGLIGALLVGVNFAKGLCLARDLPLIPVHHLRAHIAANYITHPSLEPPFLCLLVSGGHTHIVEVIDYRQFSVVGRTRDDAAGECFDKAARVMGLPYPGGVHLDQIARGDAAGRYPLPRPRIEGSEFDFSFSGLKTAVCNLVHNTAQRGESVDVPTLAGALRAKVCDILIDNTLRAAKRFGFRTIALAGGVSANSELRARMEDECRRAGYRLFAPDTAYCGDNAAMVGVQAQYEPAAARMAALSLNAVASCGIETGF